MKATLFKKIVTAMVMIIYAFTISVPFASAAANSGSTNNKDTWIDQESPTVTHGSDTTMIVAESNATKRYSLVSFTLPTDLGTISKIALKFYDTGVYGSGRRIDVYQSANTTWSESGITWNSDNGNYAGSSIHNSTSPGGGWQTWDIRGGSATNPLTGLTWGDTVSFTLIPFGTDTSWSGGQYYTKEYTDDTAKRPYLEITYEPEPSGFAFWQWSDF